MYLAEACVSYQIIINFKCNLMLRDLNLYLRVNHRRTVKVPDDPFAFQFI